MFLDYTESNRNFLVESGKGKMAVTSGFWVHYFKPTKIRKKRKTIYTHIHTQTQQLKKNKKKPREENCFYNFFAFLQFSISVFPTKHQTTAGVQNKKKITMDSSKNKTAFARVYGSKITWI